MFLLICSLYPLTIAFLWFVFQQYRFNKPFIRYCASISLADNEEGKEILRQSAPQGITVKEGWLILHFWVLFTFTSSFMLHCLFFVFIMSSSMGFRLHKQILVQENAKPHIRGIITLLCGGAIILVNLSIGATLCFLTIYHLQTEKTFSDNYKDYQFRILRALFAQVLFQTDRLDRFISIPVNRIHFRARFLFWSCTVRPELVSLFLYFSRRNIVDSTLGSR